MEIILNGQPYPIHTELSLAELLESLGLAGRRLAVEINLEVIPRSTYPIHRLRPNDRVEIIRAIGGG